MKKFQNLFIGFGIVALVLGYIINSKYLNIVNSNFKILTDNSQERFVSYLNVSDNLVNYSPTNILNTKQLCVFLNQEYGTPISDNAEIQSIIGNKFYLPKTAIYNDLVDLKSIGIKTIGEIQLRQEPGIWLKYMTDNIEKEGISIVISSGYRDLSLQEYIFNTKVYQVGLKQASLYAAKSGYSEHHLGTVVDILTKENNLKLLPTYSRTKLKTWLEKNAYKYGFVQSYPENKTEITGFAYEPWHYRFVGLDLAKELKNSGQTIYEYLYSQYNYCLVE